ncbi:CbtB-domain containing protein [Nocardioides lentus]|uniref:CbtB-domain containing protein n=1 Tax=Nocardioides lentus TaxID=338077 RepID=A0ABN2PJ54_9ACTN
MSQVSPVPASAAGVAVPSIPVLRLLPWLLFAGLLSLLVIFFVSADQGAVSIPAGTAIHEWVHDGRHLLAFPCH